MATLFKINAISAAMELQDEKDKQGVNLIGASIQQSSDSKISS
jgi:hypothetical protein